MSHSTIGYYYTSGTPAAVQLPQLLPDDHMFRTEVGPWTAIEATDFNLLNRFRAGEDIRPILVQRRDVGNNLLRVWTAYSIDAIGVMPQCPYDKVVPFLDLCAAHGLYVEFTAYTGFNDPQHWHRLTDECLKAKTRPLVELVNEYLANYWKTDPSGRRFYYSDYQPVPGLLCARDLWDENDTTLTRWDYTTFHTNDQFQWWRKTGHNAMELGGIVLANENTRYADKDGSLAHAQGAAESAALLCAGSCYHSVQGKVSQLWTGLKLDAARTWAASARKVDLRFQKGAYRHAQELEPPGVLRAYQRVLPDGSAYTALVPE